MRKISQKILVPSLLFAVPFGANQVQAGSNVQAKKNVLFIAVDDLKPLLGCYGDPLAKTPNIDALAKSGSIFTHSYCQQAVSGPTRASLLTGMCPDRTKVWDLKTYIRDMNPDVVTLPQYLKGNGYVTAGIGKVFDGCSVDKHFDERSWSIPFFDYEDYYNKKYTKPALGDFQSPEVRSLVSKYESEAKAQKVAEDQVGKYVASKVRPSTESADVADDAYSEGAIANGAIKFLQKQKKGKPFFLAVGFKRPHLPFCSPHKYWDMYNRKDIPLAQYRKKAEGSPAFAYHNCGELNAYTDIPPIFSFTDVANAVIPDDKARELIHGYYAAISYMDAQIGKVVEALRKKGLDKNTVIVLWGDHGWHLGDHGLWNKHTNFEQATHTPLIVVDPSIKPSVVTTPVEFLDVYPTICDLAGVDNPTHLDGRSLVNIMSNPSSTKGYKKYAVSQFPRGNKMGYSIRDSRYRYTVWVDWSNKVTNLTMVYAVELYDYEKDPLETQNLAKDASYASVVSQMEIYWNDFIKNRISKTKI